MVATSPFSACLSPTADVTLPASFDKRNPQFSSAGDNINRPPRPHTTTAATSTSFFPPNSTRHLWDDIRELTTDVKDGVMGLKEVWETNRGAPGGEGKSFIDDLSEFVEPHFESLGIVDPPHTTGNAKIGRSSSGEGGNVKFFTFDKMERLLNYCVPLAVDPRSPKSRVRDAEQNEEIVDDSMLVSTVEGQKHIEEEESVKDLESAPDALVHTGQQHPMQQQALQSRSGESIPGVSEGLLEHTNRLREKLMDRSRHRSINVLEQRMDLQGRRSGSSSSEERDVAPMVDNPTVLVPGGLWSLPSEEQRYGNSLSQSFMDSRSMHSSNSEEKHRGSKNAYYCGPDNMDDVLLMRSMSDGANDANDGSKSYDDFPNAGSDLTDVMHNNSNESKVSETLSLGFEKRSKNKMGLVLDTKFGVDLRNNVVNAAAMHAMLASPRSLDSEDKYMLEDQEVEKNKRNAMQAYPYSDTHELSNYIRDTRDVKAAVESCDENEAVNRHFDNLMSDFELNLKPDQTKDRKQDKLQQYQRKKKVVQRSWHNKKSPLAHAEVDTASKSSHVSNYSTATFLHSTTMGKKLARSNAPSSSDSVASQKESILDRARQAMSHVNQATNCAEGKNVVTETKHTGGTSKDALANSADRAEPDQPSAQKTKHTEQVPSPMVSYKKRLMEKRARRNQREFASKEREEDVQEQVAAEETVKSASGRRASQNKSLDMKLQKPGQEESNIDICASGVNSFDSSVNWDALAYSISGSMSYGSDEQLVTQGAIKYNAHKNEPIVSPRSKMQYPVMDRIEQIKEQHDKKIAEIRMVENSEIVPMSGTSTDAPDDERGEEENTPMSPNSTSSECLSPKSKAALNTAIHQHIREMKQQIATEMSNNERHKSPASTSSRRSSQFDFDAIPRHSPKSPQFKSPKSPTNEELMLRNAEIEEEIKEILALSPRSPFSRKGYSSPLSSPKNIDRDDNFAPSYAQSQGNKDSFMPSYFRNNGHNCVLKVEIPTSPISTPRRTARSTTSSSPKSTLMLSPKGERAQTRVSDLMEEVKGFLAENDRQRERIARDMEALQLR